MSTRSVLAATLAALMTLACVTSSPPPSQPVVDDVAVAQTAPTGNPPHIDGKQEARFKTNRLIMVETRPGHYVYCRKRRGILVCYGGS